MEKEKEKEGKEDKDKDKDGGRESEKHTPGTRRGPFLAPRHMKIVQMVYGDLWPEMIDHIKRAPQVTLKVIIQRLEQKDAAWRKARRDMNKIWNDVYRKNYHKSLDYRSFQFKQADKKALSSTSLAQEARAARRQALHNPQLSPSFTYLMRDEALHLDILSIIISHLPDLQASANSHSNSNNSSSSSNNNNSSSSSSNSSSRGRPHRRRPSRKGERRRGLTLRRLSCSRSALTRSSAMSPSLQQHRWPRRAPRPHSSRPRGRSS